MEIIFFSSTKRCVSPYSGNRCENEKKVVVQIAVGSCVMALVLVIALILILRKFNAFISFISES